MSAHTPGPWTCSPMHGFGQYLITSVKNRHECLPAGDGSFQQVIDEDRENVRLISAAPDLLEACKYMHQLLTDKGLGGLAGAILGGNAIAKAEGRS